MGYHFFVSNVEILYVKSLKWAQRCELKQIDIVFLECDFKLPMISEYPVNQHIKICWVYQKTVKIIGQWMNAEHNLIEL